MKSGRESNMYPGVTTWNPLGGKCEHECIYCSTKELRKKYPECERKYSGEYRLWDREFKPLGKGKRIFVVAQNDLFAAGVPDAFIMAIIGHTWRYPDNEYMWQTKNPGRMEKFARMLPPGSWLGTTIETDTNEHLSEAPSTFNRAWAMATLKRSTGHKMFITIEPIVLFTRAFYRTLELIRPDHIYIGADSKGHDLSEPFEEDVAYFVNQLRSLGFTVELKSNLKRIAPSLFNASTDVVDGDIDKGI